MNCLPIAERELRVAAAKGSTFWLRLAAAVTGLVVGGGCLIFSGLQHIGSAELGTVLFHVLAWMCLVAGLSAGVFFTSDCLSEEKREGTLGLLFLTDLKGYEVVLGKLLATSLRAFYALLAVLPILAITQLMGGVTAAQYWKSALALVNALVFSLAVGMVISATSRDSQKALGATLLVLLLFALGGIITDAIIAKTSSRGLRPCWSLSSPAYVLWTASAWGRAPFWKALLVTHLLTWAFLAVTCAWVPHAWQEAPRARSSSVGAWSGFWKYGGRRRRATLRRKFLESQPVVWLTCRERWQALVVWAAVLLTSIGFATVLMKNTRGEAWILWNYLGGVFSLLLYLWAASQACRFLAEARRSRLLELLLVAPVDHQQIVRGQWRALLRMFGLPVILLLGANVIGAALSQLSFQRIAAQVGTMSVATATNSSGTSSGQTNVVSSGDDGSTAPASNLVPVQSSFQLNTQQQVGTIVVTIGGSSATATNAAAVSPTFQMKTEQRALMTALAAATAAVSTAANLIALCWFGMWMGLTSRSANLATLKTILFVQVIPWFAIAFASTMLIGMVMAGTAFSRSQLQPAWWLVWWPLLSAAFSGTLAVGKDVGFILWSRHKLYSSLRTQAARL